MRTFAAAFFVGLIASSCSAPCQTVGGITSTTCMIGPNARAGSPFTISFDSFNGLCELSSDGGAFVAKFPVSSSCPAGGNAARPAPQPAMCSFPALDAGTYPFDVGGTPQTVIVPDDGGFISCG